MVSAIKKGVDITKKIKKLKDKLGNPKMVHPGLPKLHKGANIQAHIQRAKNVKILKKLEAEEKKRKKLTLSELLAESGGSGDLGSTLGKGNPGGTGGQVHTSPPKWKLDTEYSKGGSVRKQRRLAKRGWGVTKRK